MKKQLHLFLTIIVSVGVLSATAVSTAPKAASQTESSSYVSLYYAPGRTYTFYPSQFNLHSTSVQDDGHLLSQHNEYSYGGIASAEASFKKGQSSNDSTLGSGNAASLGIEWQLYNAPTRSNGKLLGTCTVIITATYTLSATGNEQTQARIFEEHTPGFGGDREYVYGTAPQKTVSKTFTEPSGLDWVFPEINTTTQARTGGVHIDVGADQSEPAPLISHAVARVSVSSISITFGNTPAPSVTPTSTPIPSVAPTSAKPRSPSSTPTTPIDQSVVPLASGSATLVPSTTAEAKQIPEFPFPIAGAAIIVVVACIYAALRRR
ncbi:MAG: hypothetical protein ACXV2E_05955 [Halobacteriota archaeon]